MECNDKEETSDVIPVTSHGQEEVCDTFVDSITGLHDVRSVVPSDTRQVSALQTLTGQTRSSSF